MELATATPPQIDAEISRLHGEAGGHFANAQAAYKSRDRLFAVLRENKAPGVLAYGGPTKIGEKIEALESLIEAEEAAGRELLREAEPFTAEFARRGGWSRVYLVTNSNGHVHTHTHCRNTYATTQFYWVTTLSGATEEEVVAEAGERTCLTCFPSVREEIIAGRPCKIETPQARKTREEREAKAAARAAEKAIKGITNPDGTPLHSVAMDYHGKEFRIESELKTEIAASRKALEVAWDLESYNVLWNSGDGDHPFTPAWEETLKRCVAALAHKRGTTDEVERAAIDKKVAAKAKNALKEN